MLGSASRRLRADEWWVRKMWHYRLFDIIGTRRFWLLWWLLYTILQMQLKWRKGYELGHHFRLLWWLQHTWMLPNTRAVLGGRLYVKSKWNFKGATYGLLHKRRASFIFSSWFHFSKYHYFQALYRLHYFQSNKRLIGTAPNYYLLILNNTHPAVYYQWHALLEDDIGHAIFSIINSVWFVYKILFN